MFVLTEINVYEDDMEQLSLPVYAGFFCPRANSCGVGIAVYVRSAWSATRFNVAFDCYDCLAVMIDSGIRAVVILALYGLPSAMVQDFLSESETYSSKLALKQRLCLVDGISIVILRQHRSSAWDNLTLLSTCGVDSLILAPTGEEHFPGDLVISCVDHVHVRV